MKKLLFGVHNDEFNMDFYDDNSIEIYDHKKGDTITRFDEETVALFIALLKRDGYIDKLLEKAMKDKCDKCGLKDDLNYVISNVYTTKIPLADYRTKKTLRHYLAKEWDKRRDDNTIVVRCERCLTEAKVI